ncbi:MAG: hypothetical protein LQ341_005742 [Variospora aurantia]|nr:MAG: hypothetical protein LQ341_005742 [Variospora aurantia]
MTDSFHPSSCTGVQQVTNHNGEDYNGMASHVENWYKGKSQPAGKAYGLDNIQVRTNSTVKHIVFETRRAVGAELIAGEILRAEKGIVLPVVGKNFSDHAAVTQFYFINEPEKGLCAPSPHSNHPSYLEGFPTDYIITQSVPTDSMLKAIEQDHASAANDVASQPHVVPPRSHYEILPMYAPTEVPLTDLNILLDGSIIRIGLINLLATSRGTVTFASTGYTAGPAIDPNYCATEVARVILRTATLQSIVHFFVA